MSDSEDRGEPRGLDLGYIIYRHLAGMLGAFALAAFLEHFFFVDWRGALADLVGMWHQIIRPVLQWVFGGLSEIVRVIFDWNVRVPLIVQDYVAVGLILHLSFRQAVLALRTPATPRTGKLTVGRFLRGIFSRPIRSIGVVLAWLELHLNLSRIWKVLIWPIRLAEYVRGFFYFGRHWSQITLSLSPMIYLAVLLAVNYLLLKPGT